MTVVGETRVLPEDLETTWERISEAFAASPAEWKAEGQGCTIVKFGITRRACLGIMLAEIRPIFRMDFVEFWPRSGSSPGKFRRRAGFLWSRRASI